MQGYYVYALVDPRTNTAFYIGKGIRNRHAEHARRVTRGTHENPLITLRVRQIRDAGLEVQSIILTAGLHEAQALKLERLLIQRIGRQRLANQAPGTRFWAEAQMAAAANLLQVVKATPPDVYPELRAAIIENCEEMVRGRRLTSPVITCTPAGLAEVRRYWDGTWRQSIESIEAAGGTA